MLEYVKRRCDRKNVFSAILISLILTLFTLTGFWSTENLQFVSTQGTFLLWFVEYFSLYFVIVLIILQGRRWLMECGMVTKMDCWMEAHVSVTKERRIVLIGLLLLYIPSLLAFFPGIFGYDGPVEMFQVYGEIEEVTAHHPLAHIYFMKACFEIGHILSGSYNTGLFLYSVIQMLAMTGIFVYLIMWMRKKNFSALWRILAFLYFAWNPVVQLLNLNTTKDTLWSGFFLLGVIFLMDLLEEWSRKNILRFLFAAFGMCIFRNQGYIILAFVAVGVLLLLRKKGLKTFGIMMVSVVVGWFLMRPCVDIFGIEHGDSREMYSIPMQQLARVWNEAEVGNVELLSQERELIETLILKENLQAYVSYSADFVKSGFITQVFEENKKEYLQLYFRLALKYPGIYVRAFTELVSGFWDIRQYGEFRGLLYTNTYTDPFFNVCQIGRKSLFPAYESYLVTFSEKLASFPVFNVLFSHVLPVWLLFIVLVDSLFQRRWKLLATMMFLFGQWGIMLLSPAMLVRYAYPLMICVPVLIAFIAQPEKAERELE